VAQVGYGQEYAIWTPSFGRTAVGLLLGSGGVENPSNAATVSDQTFALMRSDRLELLSLGLVGTDSYLELKFPVSRSAGATTFVKISKPTITGLNLDLAALLGLAGENIVGEVREGAGNGVNQRGVKIEVDVETKLIVDKNDNYYLAITPKESVSYNSVSINLQYPAATFGLGTIEMNVYHAFTLDESVCNQSSVFTNFGEADGVNLTLLSELVANPHHAISDNPNEYSSFSSGVLNVGVASSIRQAFYFDHLASTNDGVRAKLGFSKGLLELGLGNLNSINFKAYNGVTETPVWSGNLEGISNLLGLTLSDIIIIGADNRGELELVFRPGVSFDRIEIEFNAGLLGLGVLDDALRVYNISLAPSTPEISEAGQPDDVDICEGETASFQVTATVPQGTLSYQWQVWDGTSWQSVVGETSSILNIPNVPLEFDGNQYRVQITGGNIECPQTIYSDVGKLNVSISPGKPHLTISDVIN